MIDEYNSGACNVEELYNRLLDLTGELPAAYSKELYQQKCDLLYQHIYDSYFGQGRGIYTAAA